MPESGRERRRFIEAATRTLDRIMIPLWDLGANSLVGWQPTTGGLDVLLVPCDRLPGLGALSSRLIHGRRLMGRATFAQAVHQTGATPNAVALPFRVSDLDDDALSTASVERALRRYAITLTQHRGVALFDIVGFSRLTPLQQAVQITSLDHSINAAQASLLRMGVRLKLARSTTGDGFYLWNRSKGANADLATYLLMLFVLADNAIALSLRGEGGPFQLRACFSIGAHISHWLVERLRPSPFRHIVGDITIVLARLCEKSLPGQILVGEFQRPAESDDHVIGSLEFVERAAAVLGALEGRTLGGARVESLECYLTGDGGSPGTSTATRLDITDKHRLTHHAYNLNLNLSIRPDEGQGNAVVVRLGC